LKHLLKIFVYVFNDIIFESFKHLTMKRFFLLVLLFAPMLVSQAQVGINTPLPHSSAALHINGNETKGLLIPVMTASQRKALKNPKGLIVCDTTGYAIPMFYICNGKKWIALNPLQASENSLDTLKLSNSTKTTINFANNIVVIGKSTLNSSVVINDVLTVNGKTTLQESVEINNTMTINGAINAKNNIINAGTVSANNVSAVSSVKVGTNTEITSDKVKTTTLEGFGVTPIGGIIMWRGTTAPDGWALCNGQNDTPNLSERFIVGYGGEYDTIGGTGGQKEVTLTEQQMPSHTHTLSTHSSSNDNAGGNNLSQTPSNGSPKPTMAGKVNSTGGGESHENRPPYYVLAFIMRIK